MRMLFRLAGFELTPTNHLDKFVSGCGGFTAIAVMTLLTHYLVSPAAVMPVVASMGASAVLLFAAPPGQLSQPWPLAAGHLISAIVGVTCARFIDAPMLAGAAAVGIAITAMYYGRCIHPPGGATALTAVLGGSALGQLGYQYVLVPVMLNVLVMLSVAVAFNAPFRWRRYPAGLSKPRQSKRRITREDWRHALRHVGTVADITEDDLIELHDLALEHSRPKWRRSAARPSASSSEVRAERPALR